MATYVDRARTLFGDGLRGVVLFGSVARGEQGEGSDIDLLVVLHDDVPMARGTYRLWDEQEPADDVVNPHFVHLPSSLGRPGSLWIEVALDGLILHDPSGELTRFLSGLRRSMASGGVSSGTAHGQPYWVHDAAEGSVPSNSSHRDHLSRAGARLKALVRSARIEVPRVHDVSPILDQNRDRFPAAIQPKLDALIHISRQLRRDRELAFYGSEDLTPSEFYTKADAATAAEQAREVERCVAQAIRPDG